VTGGVDWANAQISINGPGVTASESHTRAGGTVGGGVEWAFLPSQPRLTFKAEYLYVSFGNTAYFNPLPSAAFADRAGGVKLNDHIVRVGLNWQFIP
jgi:outer membrane immunogenic protein